MKEERVTVDIEQYTNLREIVNNIPGSSMPPFIIGLVYGGLLSAALLRRWWWLLVILVVWPLLLYLASIFLPMDVNVAYRVFFMALVTLGAGALAYYLKRY